jgi:colanic acid/amylovoran biosynthesis protein
MNVLLLNAHSPQNAGDLAILQESLACLRIACPSAKITVTINDDRGALPPDVRYIPSLTRWLVQLKANGEWRWRKPLAIPYIAGLLCCIVLYRCFGLRLRFGKASRRQLLDAYYTADLVAVIGGGHLYARHALNIAFLWLWCSLAFALALGKPLIFLPQSFGPLPGRLQRSLLRLVLNRSTLIAAREYQSLHFLSSIGVRQRVLVLPDLAFAMHNAGHAELALQSAPGPLIGLTLMDWGGQNASFQHQSKYELAVVALIEHLQQQYAASILLFAQCTGPTPDQDDRRIARRIAAALHNPASITVVDAVLSPGELQAAYSQLDLLVATRMHSAIFALTTNTPVLLVSYLHKSVGLMGLLGLNRYVLDIATIDAEHLCTRFDQVWCDREHIRRYLAKRIPALRTTLAHLPVLIQQSLQQL